jgi:CRP/FNR family cyclic AMP-dependent transcriptional regulator
MSDILIHCTDLPEQTFEAREPIVTEGGSDKRLFILIEGTVEVLKEGLHLNMVSQPGAFFGEITVLLDTPHLATVRAVDRSRLYVIEDGEAFLAARPELALGMARLVARRLRQVTTYLTDLKQQFQDHEGHLGMVDEVLASLLHDHPEDQTVMPGSDREYEPNI